jgi:hypothetical protein
MAKQLVVTHAGTELAFGLTRIERSKIYGTRRRVVIDAQERPCVRAALSADGRTLIASGMTGQGHFTPDGRWVARGENAQRWGAVLRARAVKCVLVLVGWCGTSGCAADTQENAAV